MCKDQRAMFRSQFSLSPLPLWVPEIKFRLSGLCGKHLYPLCYLTGPKQTIVLLSGKTDYYETYKTVQTM